MKAVILSDGKQGHVTQSVAVCTLKGWSYEIVKVSYRFPVFKAFSYLLDKLGVRLSSLVKVDELPLCDVLVGTGSTTYYPLKVLGKNLGVTTVAVMSPKGYTLQGFDWIVAPLHDNPPLTPHTIVLPINPVLPPSKGVSLGGRYSFSMEKRYIALVIGGANETFSMTKESLTPLLETLFLLDDVSIVVTTSRRTPKDVEESLKGYPFEYCHFYSQDPFNPIPAFLTHCERVIITSDSTSMISEAVVGGKCAVEVLMLPSTKEGKFHTLIHSLAEKKALHIFDGTFGNAWEKIDLKGLLKESLKIEKNEKRAK